MALFAQDSQIDYRTQRGIVVRNRTFFHIAAALLIGLAYGSSYAQEQSAKNSLCFSPSNWVGKYASASEGNRQGGFFDLPCVREQIATLLPESEYRVLLSKLESESQIEKVGRFVIVALCEAHNCPAHHAMVIADSETGHMIVGIYLRNGSMSRTTWYSNGIDPLELPPEILAQFLARHGPG